MFKMFRKKLLLSTIILLLLPILVFANEHLPQGVLKLIEHERELSLSINLIISLLAGLISFTSPCGFAIFPTYLAFAYKDKKKALQMTSVFSLGMLLAFTIFGFIAGFLGNFLNQYKLAFATFSGYLLIIFGIMLLLNIGFSILNFKINAKEKKGIFGIAILGFLFGSAWTPCVSPILIGILLLAVNTSSVLLGTLNLFVYGLGVVIPLLIIAYFSDKYNLSEKKIFRGKLFSIRLFKKHFEIHSYNLIGGTLLIAMGLLIAIYKGTFFFQTTMLNYIPWSMSLWGYLNDRILEIGFLKSKLANIFGIFIALFVIILIFSTIKKRGESK